MEVIKQNITIGKNVFDGQVSSGCEGSIIVPDIKPDIIKILQVDADTFLCDKLVEDGKVTLNGKVNVTVLYIPEDEENTVCSIKGSFEFCEVIKKTEFSSDMNVVAVCDAESVSYKLINSRKVGIEARIIINLQISDKAIYEIVSDIDEKTAECLFESINVTSPGGCREHNFIMEEKFAMSGAKPRIKELLKGNVMIMEKEYKALSDRVVVKGNGLVSVLYLAEGGEVEYFQKEMPFTEVIDMQGLCEDIECDICFEVGEQRLSFERNSADTDEIMVSYDVACIVRTEEEQEVTGAMDCYFTDAKEALEYVDITADEVVARPRYACVIKEIIKTDEKMPDISGIYSAVAKPRIDSVKISGNKICVSGKIVVYVLYTTSNIQVPVCSLSEEIPFTYAIDCDGATEDANILLKSECDHISTVICANDAVEVRCGISILGKVQKKKSIKMLKDVKKGDVVCKENGILVYFAKKDDNLWDIGKKYRVTQKCVCDAMQGQDEISDGMKLIIPVVR